jgi:hypothetical protein
VSRYAGETQQDDEYMRKSNHKWVNIKYYCFKCDHEFKVTYYFSVPAVVSGPIEHQHSFQQSSVDPDYCPQCDELVDRAKAHEIAIDQQEYLNED